MAEVKTEVNVRVKDSKEDYLEELDLPRILQQLLCQHCVGEFENGGQ